MKVSLVALLVTATFQVVIVVISGSVALFADTLHNFGDALTAVPLWIAFWIGRRPPNKRFTYGYGRLEDLAGLIVLVVILFSAIIAARESIRRFIEPQEMKYLGAVVVASLAGFVGNEVVALFRIRVGRQIGSTALIADGYHARVDGLTSLAVFVGAIGVWLGYPLADPLVGLGITVVILKVLWDSSRLVLARLLDGVDPEVVDEIIHAVELTPGVQQVTSVRVRWLGHRLRAELNIAVSPNLSVSAGHAIARQVHHQLLHQLRYLSEATIHVDPADASGDAFHGFIDHQHDDIPTHSHR